MRRSRVPDVPPINRGDKQPCLSAAPVGPTPQARLLAATFNTSHRARMGGAAVVLLVACLCCDAAAENAPVRYASPTVVTWIEGVGGILVLASGTGQLAIIDPEMGEIRRFSAGAKREDVFVFTSDRRWMALVNPWRPELVRVREPLFGSVQSNFAPRQPSLKYEIDPQPQAVALTADGRTILVACDPPGRSDRQVCIVVADSGAVTRRAIPGSSNLRGIAVDPAGRFALAVHLLPKSHLPSTQIEQGWVFTNAISYLSLTGPPVVVTFPLDLRTQSFANPEGVVISPKGDTAYVTHAGADLVSVIDVPALRALVDKSDSPPLKSEIRNPKSEIHADLTLTRRYVRARIPVGANPRGLALSPDGKTLAVANRLSDSVSLIDTQTRTVTKTVVLSDRPPDLVRQGEILFHSAKLSFGGQFSCASCHPGGHTDGLNWDLPADGFSNFLNTKTLLGTEGTAPYGWLGKSDTLRDRFHGTLRHLFQHEPDEAESAALEAYLAQLQYPDDLPRRVDPASPAVLRGKALFHGAGDCAACHSGPKLTDRATHDIGTGDAAHAAFDTPSLVHIAESAPYLHDGRAATLAEIFTRHNAARLHGDAADLSAEQIADLVEYLKSL